MPDDEITVDDCEKWARRLERFAVRFEEKGDPENARIMAISALLMDKFAFDIEVQATSPFLLKAGEA